MAVHFAVDFGTTNTVVVADSAGSVVPLALQGVMAERTGTPVVPSAVYFPESGGAPTIGEEAVNHNLLGLGRRPSFAQGFKRHLGGGSFRPVASLNREPVSARRAGQAYFDGLRRALRRQLRPRRRGVLGFWDDFQERRHPLVGDLTLAAPVDAAEHYRRELVSLGRRMGARSIRLVDEPVAAALGYGVNVGRELTLLVLDWGGGTLDVCVVRTGPAALLEGRAEVLAKSDAPIGGDDVDAWIVGTFLVPVERFVNAWEMDAQWAARQAKEAASISGEGIFRFRDLRCEPFSRADLEALLERHGAYAALERALDETLEQLAERQGVGAAAIDEALLVGGSSMLPGVDRRVRQRLQAARVGEWNPFAAVAIGACELARGGNVADQIYHDYALRMADARTNAVYYELILPAGTRYPSTPELAERAYEPDPGHPSEVRFEVCEIARLGLEPVAWDPQPSGRRTWRPQKPEDHARALTINEGRTVLRLPAARRTNRRLRVSYRLDEDRFLRWTVWDGEALLRRDEVLGRLR